MIIKCKCKQVRKLKKYHRYIVKLVYNFRGILIRLHKGSDKQSFGVFRREGENVGPRTQIVTCGSFIGEEIPQQ